MSPSPVLWGFQAFSVLDLHQNFSLSGLKRPPMLVNERKIHKSEYGQKFFGTLRKNECRGLYVSIEKTLFI